ncbi:hypothetical protein EMIHUDRAFT_214912 [Emiliania huxleyi CCMP1516]|uniref:Rieske domain-containing protein n=2 Tax=Emiliania huxleyi TaxID=2903 RepID=A0A0D3IIL5_EMIH1|nr:hypothetical protein EMIHUDRAFT_214912 [Emiliania huxleyi CCMP1516]EOD11100.1 hypothetical protein EMIHUDRAFT_214912 [Emiliania huxleyi CCMP1516]|eukprot:XP_005763529.1 hypothetical protein EMIHUDRAFT_214912 [Emiliania huxleyi CCMP1516]
MSQWVPLRIRAESLLPGQRVSVRGKSDRVVTVLRSPDGELHAIDAYCFHHGAHLGGGDLAWALRCPAHGRLVALQTGEALEAVGGLTGGKEGGRCVSRGVKQRRHDVSIDADGNLVLRLRSDGPALASDQYNRRAEPETAGSPGAAAGGLGFQARKRRATQASAFAAAAPGGAAGRVPLPAPSAALRQQTLTGMFQTREARSDEMEVD